MLSGERDSLEYEKPASQTRSLRALRKLVVAFRSAARMNNDDENSSSGGWKIEEASGMCCS